MTEPSLKLALMRVLNFRWKDHGYGNFTCSSCGASRSVSYGDHESPTNEKRESCSLSCPWRIVANHITLFAAAPEVLSALKDYHGTAAVSRQNAGQLSLTEAWDHAEAAIAQAESENLGDCVSCDGYILNASEAPHCPTCAREIGEAAAKLR